MKKREMMLANRSVLVIGALVLLVHGEDVTGKTPVSPQQDAISVNPTTSNDRHHFEKGGNAGDNRRGKMALHAEAPSSKAKREQALRNILAARRLQLLGSRVSDVPKSPSIKTLRPVLGVSKDPPDMLEAQETRHGVYVTAPMGDLVSVIMENDEEDTLNLSNRENVTVATSASLEKIDKPGEYVDDTTKNSLLIRINETNTWTRSQSRTNETIGPKNTSQTLHRSQNIMDNENRRKNIVAMPESLYNHFRPVESNIPVEDMSQFLYFGQKLHSDSQNSSSRNNNSLIDVTSTSSSVLSSRRRNSMKRFSTTTPIPVPRLEDIINEEMNIALERSTIERNKIPKMKNVFRSPGSGTYFIKSSIRPSDPIIVSNVISAREIPRNSSVLSHNKSESVLSRKSGKFAGDSSAHAYPRDQVAIVSDVGSNPRFDSIAVAASAHRAGNVTTNNYSTQFHADVAKKDKKRRHQRGENLASTTKHDKLLNSTTDKINSEQFSIAKTIDQSVSPSSIQRNNSNLRVSVTSGNELIDRITTWQSVHSNHETTTIVYPNIESDNDARITSSTINDLDGPSDSKISFISPTTTSNIATSSSLRIVVTEPMGYAKATERFFSSNKEEKNANGRVHDEEVEVEAEKEEEEEEEKIGTKYRGEARDPVDRAYPKNNQTIDGNSHFVPSLEYSKISIITPTIPSRLIISTNDTNENISEFLPILSSSSSSVITAIRKHENPTVSPVIVAETAKTEKSEYKQQHAYAYEITNVTRLLRNYTGPGLNIAVEQPVKEDKRSKESGQAEREEEKRKSTSNKKEKKLEDERAEQREKDEALAGVGEKGKEEVERGSTLTWTNAGSITEIRKVAESLQPTSERRPLPLLLLLLPTPQRESSSSNSGGKVEPARTTVQLSAGTDVGEVTPSSSVDDDISDRVGEGGGGGGDGDGGGGGGGGGGSDIGTRNTPPPAFPTFTTSQIGRASSPNDASTILLPKTSRDIIHDVVSESTIVTSTLRWNHTGDNRIRGFVERPEIFGNDRRYNRKSASAVINRRTIDSGLVEDIKRRRGSSSLFSFSPNNRRFKGWKNGTVDENTRSTVSGSMENRTVLTDNENALSQTTEIFDRVGVTIMEMQTKLGNDEKLETRKILEIVTTVAPPGTLESPLKKLTDRLTTNGAKSETSIFGNASDLGSRPTETIIDGETTGNNLTTILSFDSTLSSLEFATTTATTTTIAPPGFPVTPRMLREPSETTSKVEVKSVDETKAEANRPFGLAKDLDPSEIQKMYRSQTTIRPESIVTTIIPELERSTDENPGLPAQEPPRTISNVNSSITRSPEVRARNLSDKSKDKDDILPIMQLYNTSNIFNGTAKDSSDSGNNARTVLQLPGINETSHDLSITSTILTTTSHNMENGHVPTSERNDQYANDDLGISRKNNGHGVDRDYNNDYEIRTKSSNVTIHENSYNLARPNRTKHRPSYHQTPPPEFLGYRPEFNSSFFEPGIISVSPRESINISEIMTKRHDGDTIATQETVAVVSYILATLVVFPIAVGVGLILRRLIIRNRKVLEESDTSSEISCRKDALNLENGDFKTSIEKAITKLPRIQHLCHEAEKPPPPPSQESRWEFPRDKLRLQTVLGQGNFGQVWKAEADNLTGHQGTTRLVAVKTVKEGASAREKEDLVRELEIMQQLGNHPNVVTLLGCCTEEEPHYLILEYVMYGKLLAYLRDHRTRQDFYNFSEDSAALTSRDLTVFGYCVARGMEYLASKKIIHRDLAARNVLVDHNKLCKIADFGMSRFANDEGEVVEARHGRNALPIRWMAPESLIYSLFTTKTDVWSFGILMWEIVTLGSTPYPDMAAREVMRNVQNGYRLERPSHCRSELFRVISRCWHADPDRRPEFQTLRRDMAQLLEDSMNGHYVDLESFASECTD